MSLTDILGFSDAARPINVDCSLDELFHLFRAKRRRETIRFVGQLPVGTDVDLGPMAEQIAATECNGPVGRVDRQRVYVAMLQSHLPTLRDAGVVDFEEARVSEPWVGPQATTIARVLDRFEAEVRA